MKVTTASGFTCEVDPERLDDWDFMCAIADSESEDAGKALRAQIYICKYMLGDEGEQRLKAHLKEVNGCTKATDVIQEVVEIFQKIKENDIKK